MSMICPCGQSAVARVPAVDEWRCLTHAIEYYTGLVVCGAASFRAGDYTEPGSQRAICRTCALPFTYLPHGERSKKTLCPTCYSRLRHGIARRAWQRKPVTATRSRRAA